jgi:hypothetical protein
LLADFKREVENRTKSTEEDEKYAKCKAEVKNRVNSADHSGVVVHLRKLSPSKAPGGAESGHLGPFTPGGTRPPPEHGWIESMENFRKALMKMHQALDSESQPQRIKVRQTLHKPLSWRV